MQRFQYLMVGLGLLLMVGIQGCAKPLVLSNITCDTMEYTVPPGESKDVLNPCEFAPGIGSSGRWAPNDTFELHVLPFGVRLDRIVDKNTGKVTRKLVAEPSGVDVEQVEKKQVHYFYANGSFYSPLSPTSSQFDPFLTISTVPPLQVSLSANPPTITRGQSSQLRATATGGIPLYEYFWKQPGRDLFTCTPGTCTNNTLSVSPSTTSMYSVSVQDQCAPSELCSPASADAIASVIVNVSGSSSFTLTVVDITGIRNLLVSSNPSGIFCFNGTSCSTLFPARTNVTLTAEVNKVSWTGCDAFSNSTCTVLMNADRKVTVLP